ncbi:MAG: thioredoxin-like domain-containing protein [Planctomycetota bacterium]|nr:thioredoxin-like domain-containing protein [Planctomycetota bacterium]
MRIALLIAVCLVPLTALAKDDGPSQSALIWARDAVAARLDEDPVQAEDFPEGLDWLNVRRPLSLERDLKQKIVLLDFWTYCCINCIHVLPDLEYLEKKYADKGLAVVGVHSAKFPNEKGKRQIREAIRRYEIHHPVVNDNEFAVWRSYGARAWPTFALVAPGGVYVGRLSGEGRREELEALILALLERFEGKLDTKPLPLRLESSTRASAQLAYPGKVAIASDGSRAWISDSNHNRIVEVGLDGRFRRAFGDGTRGLVDGPAGKARFFRPQGLAEHQGALYVCDTANHVLRRIDLETGAVTTVAGTGAKGNHYALLSRKAYGPWPGKETDLSSPWDILFVNGTGYVCMAGSHTLWTFDPKANTVAHFAGDGSERRLDHEDLRKAAFAQPSGITWDGKHLYIADSESSAIVRVGLTKGVKTLAGASEDPKDLFHHGDVDGAGKGRRFQHPMHVLFHRGTLYVADAYNHKIKTVDRATGEVRTLLGRGSAGLDDVFRGERFSEPSGLAAWEGGLFVADTNNHVLRRVTLAESKVRTVKLAGIPIPRAQAKAGGVGRIWPELPGTVYPPPIEQTVTAGKAIQATMTLAMPPGWKLTEGAPSMLRVRMGAKLIDKAVSGAVTVFEIPALPAGRHQLDVRLLYYVCQDDGACRVRSVDFTLRLEAKDGGPGRLGLSDAFEP